MDPNYFRTGGLPRAYTEQLWIEQRLSMIHYLSDEYENYQRRRTSPGKSYYVDRHKVIEQFIHPMKIIRNFGARGSPYFQHPPNSPATQSGSLLPSSSPRRVRRRPPPDIDNPLEDTNIYSPIYFTKSGTAQPGIPIADLLGDRPCHWMQGHADLPFKRIPGDRILLDFHWPKFQTCTKYIHTTYWPYRNKYRKGPEIHLRRSTLAKLVAKYIASLIEVFANDGSVHLGTAYREGATVNDLLLVSLEPKLRVRDQQIVWHANLDMWSPPGPRRLSPICLNIP